ncbi:MAG: DUF1508 domain-containing protein [Mariniphaga sp.]
MSNFNVHKLGEGRYYVALLSNEGYVILRGNECSDLTKINESIETIRASSSDLSKYEKKISSDGKFYFKLLGPDGTLLARSKIFETEEERSVGITWVRQNTLFATVQSWNINL